MPDSRRTSGRRLVVSAFWTNEHPDSAAERMVDAIRDADIAFKNSGEIVAIEEVNVDRDLRNVLRTFNMPIVAAYPQRPTAQGQKDPS